MLATAPMYWRCKVHSCSSACSSENLHPLLAWTPSSLWTRWQPEAIHKNKRKSQSQMLLSQKSGIWLNRKWKIMVKRILKTVSSLMWERVCLELGEHPVLSDLSLQRLAGFFLESNCVSLHLHQGKRQRRWDKAKSEKVCGSTLCLYVIISKVVPCRFIHCRFKLS